jgi:hypothetical protein
MVVWAIELRSLFAAGANRPAGLIAFVTGRSPFAGELMAAA